MSGMLAATRRPVQPLRVSAAPVRPLVCPAVTVRPVVERCTSIIAEAQNAKRRQRTIARQTEYNKYYRTRIKSTTRKVVRGYEALMADIERVSTEADLQAVDADLYKAFSYCDKAVSKGVVHVNTAARRKRKLTTFRKRVLAQAGLYTPEAAAPAA